MRAILGDVSWALIRVVFGGVIAFNHGYGKVFGGKMAGLTRVVTEMGLPAPFRAKGKAVSTAADVLEALAPDHAIVRHVLEYRQLSKLKGTYVDALPALIRPETGRLHTSFNLTGAAAGSYTLTAQQGAQSATAPTPFQVVAANPASLNVVLITPQFIRSGRTGSIVVTYTNPTGNDLVAPLLDISSANANVLFSTPDDPNNFVKSAQVLAVAPSGPAGILRPGQSGQFTLTLLSNDTAPGED